MFRMPKHLILRQLTSEPFRFPFREIQFSLMIFGKVLTVIIMEQES